MRIVRPKTMPDLKTLLSRTAGLVSTRRPAVRADDTPADTIALDETTARPRTEPTARRWPAWLKTLSLDRSTVSASIEGTSLRIVSLTGQQVVGWASIPLASDLVRHGQIANTADLGDVIDEAFARLGLSRRRVAWALPGLQATARILELPGLTGERLREAVAEEIEQSLGAAADDSYLFWQRLEGRVRSRQVFVLVVPKSTVLNALETLEAADIHPYTMDLRSLALARAVGRRDAIIANLEDGSLDVAIVVHAVPALLRSIALPTINLEAAQNRLVDEIDRALTFYDETNPSRPLAVDVPLYLTGRLATGISLAEKARTITGHPIGHPLPGFSYPPDFPVGEYLVNLGLALKRQ